MSKEIVMQCPTAMSAILTRLFTLENEKAKHFDPMEMASWWARKIDDPDEGDAWLDGRLWRLYARHIHALTVVNVPEAADVVAYILGIGSTQIAQPVLLAADNEEADPLWVLSEHFYAHPPHDFQTWQKPLRLRRPLPPPDDVDSLPSHIDPSQVRGAWSDTGLPKVQV